MDFLWKNGDPWMDFYKETYAKGTDAFTAMTENGTMHIMDFSTYGYTRVPNFHLMQYDNTPTFFTSLSLFTSCGFFLKFSGDRWRASSRVLAVAHGNVVEELGPMWESFGEWSAPNHQKYDCQAHYCVNKGIYHGSEEKAQEAEAQDNTET